MRWRRTHAPVQLRQAVDHARGVLLFAFSVWLASGREDVRYVLQDEVLAKMSLPPRVANSVSSLHLYAVVIAGRSWRWLQRGSR